MLRFTFRQQEFARLYAAGLSTRQAALHAGYTQNTADSNAHALLRHPRVQDAIKEAREEQRLEQARYRRAGERLDNLLNSQDERLALQAVREARQRRRLSLKPSTTLVLPEQVADTILPTEADQEPCVYHAQDLRDELTRFYEAGHGMPFDKAQETAERYLFDQAHTPEPEAGQDPEQTQANTQFIPTSQQAQNRPNLRQLAVNRQNHQPQTRYEILECEAASPDTLTLALPPQNQPEQAQLNPG